MSSALTYIVLCYATLIASQSMHVDSAPSSDSPPSIDQEPVATRYSGYTYTPGVGAHKVHTEAATWNEARKTCYSEDGHLVIIDTVAEAEAVGRLLNESNSREAFIGVHDMYAESEFVTIHGDPLARTGYDVWRKGEPNNADSNENCVSIYADGEMNDIPCNARRQFICELSNIVSPPQQDSRQQQSTQVVESSTISYSSSISPNGY